MARVQHDEYKSLTLHPLNILTTLLILGLCALFLGFTFAYIYTRVTNGLAAAALPNIFIFNSIFLLGASAMLLRAKKAYENDNTKAYQLSLLFTVILTLVFMCLQYFGWTQLGGLRKGLGSQYIYALSYLHFAHIIGGIPFLLIFLRNAYFRMKEPVSVLVYFSDPEKKLKLKLLTMYWHFLDGLWVFLVVLFLLSSLIDRFV